MTTLITGGAGFIGQHLARALTGTGYDVVALDLLQPQVHQDADASRAAFPGPVIVGDVAEENAWRAVGSIDAIIHLAAETGTGQSMYEQDRYTRVNVEGTRLAAREAVRRGIPIVSMSSRAVYGEGRAECDRHGTSFGRRCCAEARAADSTEDDPHHPVSVYGQTKSTAEHALLEESADRIPTAIIRPQNVVGPGQALHNPYTGVLAAFLARLREGRPLSVYGDGSQTRDVVDVSDVVAVLVWAHQALLAGGDPLVLNSGSGERVTLAQLARFAIAGSPRPDTEIEYVDVHRSGDIQDACADLSRLRSLGAPLPGVTPADAVARFIRWAWERPGAESGAWDSALEELRSRGMTS